MAGVFVMRLGLAQYATLGWFRQLSDVRRDPSRIVLHVLPDNRESETSGKRNSPTVETASVSPVDQLLPFFTPLAEFAVN